MKTRVLLLMTLGLIAALSTTFRVQAQAPPPAASAFVANELLISFEPWASVGQKAFARARLGAAFKQAVLTNVDGQLELAALPQGASILAAIQSLAGVAGVQYAEPNWVYTRSVDSNDPFYTNGTLWGMYGDATTPANQFGSQAGEAWAEGHTGDAGVYVAIIDEGIDINHQDLAGNIWVNPFDPTDGIDNDGNGRIDDTNGWDFFQNNRTVFDGVATNPSIDSHGTHVAGTIGGVGGNATGVVGVNWDVTMISAKFLGPNGGTTANAVAAVNYVTDLKTRHGLNIVATNNSWGGGGYSQALHDAIIRGAKADILFIAAAGNANRNNDVFPHYPANYNTLQGTPSESAASYDAVISVASITSTGARSSFSQYGQTTVDLGAPGSSIVSTTPFNTYASFSGTSMATPHVTGAAALYASAQLVTSGAQIRQAIMDAAVATPTASMTNITVTNGRLNIGAMLGDPPEPQDPPDAPSNLTATPVSPSRIDLAWTDGSDDETGFAIERCTGASCSNFVEVATVGANATAYANNGLAGNTTYRYRVLAFNNGGDSAPSNIASAATPPAPTAPPAPTNLTATSVSASQINLSWTDASSNETSFRIERCTGASCTNFAEIATVAADTTAFQNSTGLAAGTTYRYRVFAVNSVGSSAASNIASAATSGGGSATPAAPTSLVATPGPAAGQITLTWVDNSNNETGFRIFRCAATGCVITQVAEVGANTVTFTDTVTSGVRYAYNIRAFNAAGMSPPSNGSSTVAP